MIFYGYFFYFIILLVAHSMRFILVIPIMGRLLLHFTNRDRFNRGSLGLDPTADFILLRYTA